MTTLRRLGWIVLALMGLSVSAFAQTATTQTTLSAAVTASAQTVTVASASNIAAGAELEIDQENLKVTAISSTTVTVQRGQNGTQAVAHPSSALVWVSPAPTLASPNVAFIDSDPQGGTCVAAQQAYLPAINRRTGMAWGCPNSVWIRYELTPPEGIAFSRTPVSNTSYTVLLTDYIVAYTSLQGTKTVTLPAAAGNAGHVIIIKDEGGNVTTTVGILLSGTVDGSASSNIGTTAYTTKRLYSDGSNWFSW